jgi:hypothetical protein
MKPEVVNMPVPTMLAITSTAGEKKPISLFRSWLLGLLFKVFLAGPFFKRQDGYMLLEAVSKPFDDSILAILAKSS